MICDEDLLLSDGVTRAWANQGGETKVYDPEKSIISSAGSQGSVDYGHGPDALDESQISTRLARPSTGSIDQVSLDGSGSEESNSVKFVKNQQIVEADNCCF